MKKKMIKTISIVLFAIMMITISTQVFALEPTQVNVNTSVETKDLNEISGTILGLIRAVGIIISVGVLMVIGIKYMMGSAEEKAEYKKTMMPYIVGAVILFAASNLAQSIYSIFNK